MHSISRRGFVISARRPAPLLEPRIGWSSSAHAGASDAASRRQDSSSSRSATSRSSRCTTASGRRRTTRASSRTPRSRSRRPRSRLAASTDGHVPIPFTRSRRQDGGKLVRSTPGTGAQLRADQGRSATSPRTTRGRRHRSGHGRTVDHHALPWRSHQRPDRQATPTADLPERRDHRAGGRVQVLDGSGNATGAGAAGEAASNRPRVRRAGTTSSSTSGDKEVVPGVKPLQHQRPHARPHVATSSPRASAADRAGRRHQPSRRLFVQEPRLARRLRYATVR